MFSRSRSLSYAFRNDIDSMRDERTAQAQATKADRHADGLARARERDQARMARNATEEKRS